MADTQRIQDAMHEDPAALRRRARRRLVGAIAIALVAIVVVPMLFDPDPKPLGSDVDIRIPSQESPFVSKPMAPQGPATPVSPLDAGPSTPVPSAPPEVKTEPAEPTPVSPPPPKAVAPEAPKEAKTAARPAQDARKTEPVRPKPEAAFASRGYYLQLGAFSSEVNAKALLAKAQAAGFQATLTDSHGQYRVRVGPIPERDKAMDTLAKLKGKGFSPVLIGP
jgi:DedD protein